MRAKGILRAYRPVVAVRGEPGTKPPQGGFCVYPHESLNLAEMCLCFSLAIKFSTSSTSQQW